MFLVSFKYYQERPYYCEIAHDLHIIFKSPHRTPSTYYRNIDKYTH